MGFRFVEAFKVLIGKEEQKVSELEVNGADFFNLCDDMYIREIAFWGIVTRIARALAKCEFRTYEKGVEVKGEDYYRWNVEPNQSQNSSTFLGKLVSKLYRDNEVLIVEVNSRIYIADYFSREVSALYDDRFTQVTVNDLMLGKTFYQSEVMFLQLNSEDMRKLVCGFYETYRKLIAYSIKSYTKAKGSRGILDVDAAAEGKMDFEQKFATLMNERFKTFFNADNAVLPLFDGYKYTDLGNKTYSSESSRDIKAMIDDVTDFTAKAFAFPPSLARGDVQDTGKSIQELLTFCIDPLADMIQEEINRKCYGKQNYLEGTYLRIDTTCIKHVDVLDVAGNIEKLISSGPYCINDIRRILGETQINEEWAYQHFITKNYSTIQDLLESLNIKSEKEEG